METLDPSGSGEQQPAPGGSETSMSPETRTQLIGSCAIKKSQTDDQRNKEIGRSAVKGS